MSRRYKVKPSKIVSLNSDNQYLLLAPEDALYKSNLKRLRQPDFKTVLLKITRDINLLLYMNETQFWKELEENQTVKINLESCLSVLPRRILNQYENEGKMGTSLFDQKDQMLSLYSILINAVLLVYYRISEAPTKTAKEMLYDLWLLDIPKLLDLAALFGQSNPQIIKIIISNAYKAHPNYDRDTLDFFSLIQEHQLLLPKEQRRVVIDFTPRFLGRRNYGNPERFMVQQTAKQFYKIKDLLTNLINFFKYFPQNYAFQLAVDYKIQERLLRGLALHLKESSEDWKMGEYEKFFQWHLEDIRQTIAKYFVQEFKILRFILEGSGGKEIDPFIDLAENTYETLCLCLSERQGEAESAYYLRMVNHLLENTQTSVFFVPAKRIKGANDRTFRSIDECVRYQDHYRKVKRLAGQSPQYDEVYQRFLSSISKFKEINAKRDGPQVKKLEQKQQSDRKQRQPANLHRMLCDLKYKLIRPEYYDDPEQQDEYQKIQSPEAAPLTKNINTDLKLSFRKQKTKKSFPGHQRDEELSIWDLSQISPENNPIYDNSKLSDILEPEKISTSYLYEIPSSKRQEKIEKIDHNLSISIETENNQPQINLSVFEVKEELDPQGNLSFSMVSEVKKLIQNVSFQTPLAKGQSEDKEELKSILADIESHIAQSNIQPSNDEFQIGQDEFEDIQQYKFAWVDEQLSFQLPYQ